MFSFQLFAPMASGAITASLLQSLPASLSLSSQRAFDFEGKAWFLWAVWWLAMAFLSKSTKRRETVAQRIEHLLPAALGFLFIFRPGFGGHTFMLGIVPDYPIVELACVAATILGLVFSAWARLALGSNWSGTVTIKKDHQLIRRGPYRWIRHPIYTGMLAAVLATAISQGLISGLLGFFIVYIALYRKARREETFLAQEFGTGFEEHRRRTGMFLPRFS